MKIAMLTANEPLYLPAFFDQFLARRADDVTGLFVCKPLYKNQTHLTMLKRYVKTFGLANAFRLAGRVLSSKVKEVLGVGASRHDFHSIAAVARHYGTPVWYPRDVNSPEFLEQLRRLAVDLILSVSCPQIFRDDLISLPARGCLNLHGANLPEYRGIMPSFWMLANGQTQAGVTLFFVNAGIDTGDLAGKRLFPILPEDTLHSFVIRSKQQACELALEVVDQIESGTLRRAPLVGKGSYYGWPTREAYRKFRAQGRRLW